MNLWRQSLKGEKSKLQLSVAFRVQKRFDGMLFEALQLITIIYITGPQYIAEKRIEKSDTNLKRRILQEAT